MKETNATLALCGVAFLVALTGCVLAFMAIGKVETVTLETDILHEELDLLHEENEFRHAELELLHDEIELVRVGTANPSAFGELHARREQLHARVEELHVKREMLHERLEGLTAAHGHSHG